jgi:hypothetical protein
MDRQIQIRAKKDSYGELNNEKEGSHLPREVEGVDQRTLLFPECSSSLVAGRIWLCFHGL